MILVKIFLDSIDEFVYLNLNEEELSRITNPDYEGMICGLNLDEKRYIIPKCDIRIVEEV